MSQFTDYFNGKIKLNDYLDKVLSRHWLGFDISQEYVDLARRRVDGANVPLPLFVESVQPKPEQTSMF